MWVALGDPPKGRWDHRGIGEPFALGHWRTSPHPVERDTMKAIRRLYEHRLDADYRLVRLTAFESTAGAMTARTILRLVAEAYGLSGGGNIL